MGFHLKCDEDDDDDAGRCDAGADADTDADIADDADDADEAEAVAEVEVEIDAGALAAADHADDVAAGVDTVTCFWRKRKPVLEVWTTTKEQNTTGRYAQRKEASYHRD